MRYEIEYFNARVLRSIESWPDDVLADYARIMELLMEHGPDLRLPHTRALGQGLFEMRPRGRSGIGRAFYCLLVARRIVIVHAFVKKSQRTPDAELRIARQRVRQVLNG